MTTKDLKIYDNGGKTYDRFAILYNFTARGGAGEWDCFTMSENPTSPYGFSQGGIATRGKHLGKIISWQELPETVRVHIAERLELKEAIKYANRKTKAISRAKSKGSRIK